ncbi:hypothetical protein BJX70DRAFT_392841 [Aspergillus crustosus]
MNAQGMNEADISLDPAVGGLREHLESLVTRAAAKDAIKDYYAAAELYSEATEIQAKLNGELSIDNADLLFAYGKSLYNVAISKSDVLGSKLAGKAQTQSSITDRNAVFDSAPVSENPIENAMSAGASNKDAKILKTQSKETEGKPYFHFTGDENFDTDSDDDDGDNAAREQDNEDDDDFANAFEVLDLARILYHKKLELISEKSGKGKCADTVPNLRDIKEHLADTYDLQAEISLEGERFTDAAADLRTALELRQSLVPMEDPTIAECHYKLSLALEFGAVQHDDDDSEAGSKASKIDDGMRNEAVTQMEKAIESCRVRMSREQKKFDTDNTLDEDKRTALKRRIVNVKEIISDMEQRLLDLRRAPVSVERGIGNHNETMLKGILGQIIGQPDSEKQSLLDTATQNATDLSSSVKRKSAVDKSTTSAAAKRLTDTEGCDGNSKRARVGDTNKTAL